MTETDLCPHCIKNPCECSVNDAGESTSASTADILKERGKRYGSFGKHAMISQGLQYTLFAANPNKEYTPAQREALIMICHKLARIANGDPNYDDNWKDIAGYAELVVNLLQNKGN